MTPADLAAHYPTYDRHDGWRCWCGWRIPTGPTAPTRTAWAQHILDTTGSRP